MSFERYLHNPKDHTSLSNNIIKAIASDDSGNIWIGTYGGGLEKLNIKSNVFEHYNVGLNFISSLLFDKDGSLWIGSYGDGLVKYNNENGNLTTFKNQSVDRLSLGNDRIQTIFQGENGTIWIGTSAGFSKYNKENNEFLNFGTADGLINNVVYAILEDDNGYLWMTTNHGVSKFDPQTRQFTNFTEKDGLQSYEFNRGAAFRNRNSELLIGGINGFNIFNPQQMINRENNSPVILTAFYKWNEKIKTDSALFLKKQIQLAYNDLSFGFEFAALDYSLPPQTNYMYKMENFDENWIESGKRRFAYYTHLNPGDYTFKVKTADNNSNENITKLKILIAPPFWQTWWFYLISLIIVVFIIVLVIQIRVRQRVNRFIEIEKIKNIENERIRKKAAQDFHDGLGHKLAKISLLSQTVRTLFGPKIPEANEYFTKISDTSETLNNDMRNFLWMLNPDKDSLFEIALHLKDFGEDLFDKSGIAFRVKEIPRNFEKYSMDMDWKHNFLMLFREAMNNILKHSQCKTVDLNFELYDSQLKVCLSDDGLGFQADTKFKGNGLQNMKQRAEALKSSLKISSKKGSGTSIKFIARLD